MGLAVLTVLGASVPRFNVSSLWWRRDVSRWRFRSRAQDAVSVYGIDVNGKLVAKWFLHSEILMGVCLRALM